MQTLIIYDNTGKIFYQVSGDVIVPDGLQYIVVDIQTGYYAESVNVATKKPVLKEYPKTETEILHEKVNMQEELIAELAMMVYQ